MSEINSISVDESLLTFNDKKIYYNHKHAENNEMFIPNSYLVDMENKTFLYCNLNVSKNNDNTVKLTAEYSKHSPFLYSYPFHMNVNKILNKVIPTIHVVNSIKKNFSNDSALDSFMSNNKRLFKITHDYYENVCNSFIPFADKDKYDYDISHYPYFVHYELKDFNKRTTHINIFIKNMELNSNSDTIVIEKFTKSLYYKPRMLNA